MLFLHVRNGKFGDDERASKVDIDRVIPFFDADVEDIACPFAVACVDYQDIGMLAMLLFDFIEQTAKVSFLADVALMRRYLLALGLRCKLFHQLI